MEERRSIVLITGVSQGLGQAMLDRFDELGWTVIGCARSENKIKSLREQFNGKHHFQTVDVADEKAVAKWAGEIILRYGSPDLIINNASIINKNAPIWEISADEFANVMNINVNGTVNVIRSFVPEMIKKKTGIIVNISSSWGRAGEAELAPYCASKFAIEGLTQSIAAELPEQIAIVSLDPGGGINTAMLHSSAPQYVPDSPTPESWSHVAVPYILSLSTNDNGKALTCPKVD